MEIDLKEELKKRDELLAGYLKQIEIQEEFIQKQKELIEYLEDHFFMGSDPGVFLWMLLRSTRLPEQLFCHPSGLTAVWYILRTKVEQLHSDFVNIWENN